MGDNNARWSLTQSKAPFFDEVKKMNLEKKQVRRKRKNLMIFYVTDDEKNMIEERMKNIGMRNFSQYARKMVLDGYVIRQDFSEIKKLTQVLGYLSRNINQIALRVNQTHNIYQSDIEDLQRDYASVKRKLLDYLSSKVD